MTLASKHLLRIGLFLVILSSLIICGYSYNNHNGDSVQGENRTEQVRSIPGRDTDPQAASDQPRGGQERNIGPRASSPQGEPGTAFPGSAAIGSTACAAGLHIYAALFLLLCMAAYYFYIHEKRKIDPARIRLILVILLGAGLLLRIYAATLMTGHPYDINTFKNWAAAAANNLFQVYSNARSVDYPPLYLYILYLIGKLGSLPALNSNYPLLLKLPSIMADIATAYIIYKLARKSLSPESSIMLAAFYIFNPAVFIDSTFWGQVDSLFTLIVAGAVWALAEMRVGLASVLFMGAVMMKPQGIIFLPVLFFELCRQKSLRTFIKATVYAFGTATVIVLPFAFRYGLLWIWDLFAGTIGKYPYASVNGFNLFSLLGANYKSDTTAFLALNYHTWGMIFICLVTLYGWFIYIRGKNSAYVPAVALLLIAGVFTLAAGMHERYLFPAIALAILAFIYLQDKRLLILAGGFSLTVYINIHVVLFATIQGTHSIPYNTSLITVSLLNILLLLYLGKVLLDLVNSHSTSETRVIDAAAK